MEIVKKLRKLDIFLKSKLITKTIKKQIENDEANYIDLDSPHENIPLIPLPPNKN